MPRSAHGNRPQTAAPARLNADRRLAEVPVGRPFAAGCRAFGRAIRDTSPVPRHEGAAIARRSRSGGFTLIELLIVVVLIAVASSVASLALRDPASTTLEREGARLAALLEAARAEARASGLVASW